MKGLWLAVAAIAASLPRDARAVDPFEIQVYDGTANAPGVPSLELHTNGVVSGVRTAPAPELPQHHQVHLTFEPAVGVTRFWELGGYIQTAFRADGTYDFAGWKLRSKFVTPPGWSARARLGVNVELSDLPRRYDAAGWGMEVRPIAAWMPWRLRFAVNPIVGLSFSGERPTFEPAVQALYEIPGLLSFGLETYSDLGPFWGFAPVREQAHYIYEVVNLLAVRSLELNLGVGEGLTAASNPLVIKMILGYAYERRR
jgi:hypothetical protein